MLLIYLHLCQGYAVTFQENVRFVFLKLWFLIVTSPCGSHSRLKAIARSIFWQTAWVDIVFKCFWYRYAQYFVHRRGTEGIAASLNNWFLFWRRCDALWVYFLLYLIFYQKEWLILRLLVTLYLLLIWIFQEIKICVYLRLFTFLFQLCLHERVLF